MEWETFLTFEVVVEIYLKLNYSQWERAHNVLD